MEKVQGEKNWFMLVIGALLLVVSVLLSVEAYKDTSYELSLKHKVLFMEWIPVLATLLASGAFFSFHNPVKYLKNVIIFWPFLHLVIFALWVFTPGIAPKASLAIIPPFGFLGEAVSAGFILTNLVRVKQKKLQTVLIRLGVLAVDIFVIYWTTQNIANLYNFKF